MIGFVPEEMLLNAWRQEQKISAVMAPSDDSGLWRTFMSKAKLVVRVEKPKVIPKTSTHPWRQYESEE